MPRPPCLGGPPTSPELELRIGVGGSEWCQEWSHCQCPKSQAREMRREWAAPSSSDLDVGPAPQLSSAQDWGSSVGVRAAPGSDIQPGPKLRLRGAETPATRRIWIGLEPRGVAQGHAGRRQEQVRGLDSCGQGSAACPSWGVEWGKSGGLGFCWRCGCWLNDQSLPPPTQHLFSQSGSPHHPSPTPSGPPSQLNPRTPRNHLSPEQT